MPLTPTPPPRHTPSGKAANPVFRAKSIWTLGKFNPCHKNRDLANANRRRGTTTVNAAAVVIAAGVARGDLNDPFPFS